MNLNDLLRVKNVDPAKVLVFRHRPYEPELNRVLPWLAAEKPDTFNAYQQTQTEKVEKAMKGAVYIASFIRHAPGRALFVGVYSVGAAKPLTREQFWKVPAYAELKQFGMKGFSDEDSRDSILWFDLARTDLYADWRGKLIVGWPPPERSWWRWANRNEMPVVSILEDSALDAVMPPWNELLLSWEELGVLPMRWKSALSQWRGIYYIFDVSDRKGYVGSACGVENILGRWRNYAASGHGGNAELRKRKPRNFRFSILERVSPDLDADAVRVVERTWKERLHTRAPFGLNDN